MNTIHLIRKTAAGILLSAMMVTSASALDIYWTNGIGGQVQADNYDGSGTSTLLTFRVIMRGIDLLPTADKLYVAGSDRILYADLDGGNMNQFFVTGLSGASGLAVDRINNTIYFSSSTGINRIDTTTGTGVATTNITSQGGSSEAIALDAANQHIYFLQESDNSLRRIGYDGLNETTLVTGGNITNPEGLALDTANQRIYVSNQGTGASNIVRYDFSGNFIDTPISSVSTAGPEGAAASSSQGKLYFTASDGSGGQIRRSNLDGSSLENSFITGLNSDVQQIALVPEPGTYALIFGAIGLAIALVTRKLRHRVTEES